MGQFNSSKSKLRVEPIFDRLYGADPRGTQWLPKLLMLGNRAHRVFTKQPMTQLIPNHPKTWGRNESSFPAPFPLLEYLVGHITAEQVAKCGDEGEARVKREALARRERATVALALRELEALKSSKTPPPRVWYVLEGNSRPDATLEMEDAVLVIEGKLTELSCTSNTKWMASRSQLLRHMDAAAAYERFRGKRIFGLLLVEADGEDSEVMAPPRYWINESEAQLEPTKLAKTLPHLSTPERDVLAEGLLGVATWQAVCHGNGIPWSSVPAPPGLAERLSAIRDRRPA